MLYAQQSDQADQDYTTLQVKENMAIKPRVLFLCTENSCRTQMAEAFLRDMAGDEFEIVSAGAVPGRIDPDAVTATRDVGIDISSAQTKIVDPYLAATMADRKSGAAGDGGIESWSCCSSSARYHSASRR